MITVTCPTCGKSKQADEKYLGKKASCPCGTRFVIRGAVAVKEWPEYPQADFTPRVYEPPQPPRETVTIEKTGKKWKKHSLIAGPSFLLSLLSFFVLPVSISVLLCLGTFGYCLWVKGNIWWHHG